jgi:hypothetical protein
MAQQNVDGVPPSSIQRGTTANSSTSYAYATSLAESF